MATIAVVILLALFLWRPGASRLKSRIITSISAGVGRSVDIGSVHIQLLPRPGFDLENLVVYDDPAYGAEPILRASQVEAALRLTSLVRGRLEIARLELTEPSLNLVHGANGRWNLEALLERTAQIPLAPTSKRNMEPRPGFPYIEATAGRINFKSGSEKTPYALTNADFSLWQDSENAWGVRLKAQPFRTDLNVNDTGVLQINGTWERAPALRDTPLQINVEWKRAQLGQVTKFFAGNDKGWRGEIQLDIELTGTPAKLKISSSGSLDDFRRYDITSGKALHLAGSCDGQYSSLTHEFSELICSAPVAPGLITLTGQTGLPGSHHYGVIVRAENVPASAAVSLVERAKKNLPDDLDAEGTLQGSFSMQEDAAAGSAPRWQGRGEIADFRLSSVGNKGEFAAEMLPVALDFDGEPATFGKRTRSLRDIAGPHLEFGPVAIGPSHGSAIVRGWIARGGYTLTVVGETEISRALRLARTIGVPVLATNAEGTAQVDLQIAGSWMGSNGLATGFSSPQVTGTARLRNVHSVVRGLGGPVDIASAEMQFTPEQVRISKLNAKAGGTNWTGSVEMPRGCGIACPMRFAFNANEIVLSQFTEFASPRPKKRPWYRVLDSSAPSSSGSSFLGSLRASGRVTAGRLLVRDVSATHVSANVKVDSGKLQISELDADLLGGKHKGEWQADFGVKPSVCKGRGKFSEVSLAGFAEAMHDDWVSGTGSASYEVSGKCLSEFWPSAEGTLHVDVTDAVFPHVSVKDSALHITHLTGQADLHAGALEIKDTTVDSPEGRYELSGTASFAREIDVRMTQLPGTATAPGYAITGTLAEPQVAPLSSAEQAHLKPLPAAK